MVKAYNQQLIAKTYTITKDPPVARTAAQQIEKKKATRTCRSKSKASNCIKMETQFKIFFYFVICIIIQNNKK